MRAGIGNEATGRAIDVTFRAILCGHPMAGNFSTTRDRWGSRSLGSRPRRRLHLETRYRSPDHFS
jgi:hypothetical protein